ncbi:hypothetical protein BGX34_006029 [Mortierella sp. NVP85]|nr:hypothetical protein BGX34_006029 [Mortierella sp. NVP85]
MIKVLTGGTVLQDSDVTKHPTYSQMETSAGVTNGEDREFAVKASRQVVSPAEVNGKEEKPQTDDIYGHPKTKRSFKYEKIEEWSLNKLIQ